MSQPHTNPKNASFDDNSIPSMLMKGPDNETIAVSSTNPLPAGIPVDDNVFPKFGTGSFGTDYTVTSLGTGDLLSYEGNIDGASYLKISKSPFNVGETIITSNSTIKPPFFIKAGVTVSQKLVGVSASMGAVGVGADNVVELANTPTSSIAITTATLSGNGTILTIVTPTPHALLSKRRISLIDFDFSSLNIGPVLVASILSRTSFTLTMAIGAGFDGVYSGGSISIAEASRAKNEIGFLLDTGVATQAINYTRADNSSAFMGAAYTLTTHQPSYNTSNTRYAQGITSQGEYIVSLSNDQAFFTHNVVNNTASQTLGNKQQNQIPETNVDYKAEVRVANLANFSRPIGRIVSATKSGTSTATIVMDVPHGFTNTSRVLVQGVFDGVNFPNHTSGQIPTVVNSTTFTVGMTNAVTATSSGGVVWIMNALSTIPNQSTALRVNGVSASNNELLVNMSASAATLFGIGDNVDLYGTSPSSGVSAYEKAYLVADILTTTPFTVTLIPVVSPAPEAIPDLAFINTGGMIIRRTDVLFHWVKGKQTKSQAVEITGMEEMGDSSKAVKSIVVNTLSINGTVTANVAGQAAHSAASTGSPVRIGARVVTTQDTTLVASDTSDLITDQNSGLVITPYSVSNLTWNYPSASGGITNTTDVAIKASAGAGISNYIAAIQISNASATTATEVVIKDGATVEARIHCPAMMPTTNIPLPIPIKGSAATALNVACITTGAAVYVNAQGYTGI